MKDLKEKEKKCSHCEGKGYIEIRDCTGEIQREETCVFCYGMGVEDLDFQALNKTGA